MRRLGFVLIPAFVVLAFAAADEPKKDAKPEEKLVGTWKLVSAKYGGKAFAFPEGTTNLKHVTPAGFMWATYNKDGQISRAAGGTYRLSGDALEETTEYGLGGDFEFLKGKPQTFRCRIDGKTWRHDGTLTNGLTIEEVWERVEKK